MSYNKSARIDSNAEAVSLLLGHQMRLGEQRKAFAALLGVHINTLDNWTSGSVIIPAWALLVASRLGRAA